MNNDQWIGLGDKLTDLQHRQWQSELPTDYTALLKSSAVTPLVLTDQEKRELTFEIAQVQRQILAEARRWHVEKFGKVPAWIEAGLERFTI